MDKADSMREQMGSINTERAVKVAQEEMLTVETKGGGMKTTSGRLLKGCG